MTMMNPNFLNLSFEINLGGDWLGQRMRPLYSSLISNFFKVLAWVCLLCFVGLGFSDSAFASGSGSGSASDKVLILVNGAAGEDVYAAKFQQIASTWKSIAKRAGFVCQVVGPDYDYESQNSYAALDSAVDILVGSTAASAQSDLADVNDNASNQDKDRLRQILDALDPNEGSACWLVYVGHGSFDGKNAWMNLRGPDLSDQELASWIRSFRRPMTLVFGSASSAPMMKALSGENRTIITATRNGNEKSYCYFGEYLGKAFLDPNADLDLDDGVSILEAFLFASKQTSQFYEESRRMLTEHAALEDTGDGIGVQSSQFEGLQSKSTSREGVRSKGAYLIPTAEEKGYSQEWLAERDGLEKNLLSLKEMKSALSSEEYSSRLEKILITLALGYEKANSQSQQVVE
jgi:hypothetical protein